MKQPSMRVLVVEHNVNDARHIEEMLKQVQEKTIVVLHVGSLADARRVLSTSPVDVILASIALPDEQGAHIVVALNAIAPSTPIIVLTRLSDNGIALQAMQSGAEDYLVKEEITTTLLSRAMRYAVERKNAREEMRQSEEHFRSLIELSLDVITLISVEGTIRYVTPSIKHVLGFEAQELIGKTLFDLVHPEDEFQFRKPLERLVALPHYISYSEARFRRHGGTWRILEGNARYLAAGKERGNIVVNLRDITKRRRAEEALRASEEQYRRIVETAHEGIWMIDAEDRTSFVNKKMAEMLGYAVEEMMGSHLFTFMEKEAQGQALAHLERRRQGIAEQHEFIFRRKDGMPLWAHVSTNPVIEDGRYVGALAMVTDISGRKEREEKLRILTRAVEQSPASIVITNATGTIEYVNPKFTEMTGYTAEEIVGQNPRILKSGHMTAEAYTHLWKTITSGGVWQGEFLNKRKDGTLFWESASISPVRSEDGTVTHFVAVKEDITQRKDAEAALRRSEEKYRTLFASNPHPMWVYDLETLAFLDVNDAAVTKYGYTRDEFLGMTIRDIRPEEDVPRLLKNLQDAKEGLEEAGLWRHRKKNGEIVDVEITSHTLLYEGTRAKLVLAHDVTNRKRAEMRLQESEERYRRLFEENLTANFISTPEGRLVACNLAFVQLFGFASHQEALQTETASLFASPSDREELLARLKREKKLEAVEQMMRRRDGSPIHVIENVIGRFDAEGNLIEMTGYLIDDTKRKLLEEHMMQLQKMESLGTLAGGIAHDFNNILGIILGHSLMLESQIHDPQKLAQTIDTINKSVMRGTDLVRQILTFARKSEALLVPLQINELIAELVRMLRGTFAKTINFSLHLADDIPSIAADRTQIHQTLLNLCVNARDAMPGGGTLTIRTGTIDGISLRSKLHNAVAENYVHIAIRDTGTGIDNTTRQHIFEPFYTTKEKGKGTGLGLSVVYGIIKNHNGIIDVETELDKGTTFHLYLPVPAHASVNSISRAEEAGNIPGGSETILVVEDEQVLQELVRNLLQTAGYRVLTASDGIEAITIYEQHKEEIALVVTDLGLPKMTGLEMVKKLKAITPGLKVIFASGYLDPSDKSEITTIGAQEFIEKPYVPRELLRKLRATLDGPG